MTQIVSKRTRSSDHPGNKPNILVIWGDDIGISNLSCYSRGILGYRTPNIDRIAKEGMLFTDAYGAQSCTAGRASFITGQSALRTGLTTVGVPAAEVRLQAEDPTIAELLKDHGYATAQFGNNHLGDLNKYLPTRHGFDEFYDNLDQLKAEEEPEMYGSAPTEDFAFVAAAKDFITRQHARGRPFFIWVNSTDPQLYSHTKPASLGQAGRWQSPYHDAMLDHDRSVGELLAHLDALGISDDTFVMYSTDRGPQHNSWPDAGATPCGGAQNTHWEGAFRVPLLVRWPGKIPAGAVSNELVQHHDWLPTFLAIAGEPAIADKLLRGHQADGKQVGVHLDGYNLLPYLLGKEPASPRKLFIYFNNDGDVVALRYDNWKIVFPEQRGPEPLQAWAEPFVALRVPKLFNLRAPPFACADHSANTYYGWFVRHHYIALAAITVVAELVKTFRDSRRGKRPHSTSTTRWPSSRSRPAAGSASAASLALT